jgi:hypothetical protein
MRTLPLSLSLVLLCSLLATITHAATVAPIVAEARIEPGKSQAFTVNLTPEMLQRRLALSLLARLDSPTLGGSTYSMQVRVNGKPVEIPALLNKPEETEMMSGLKLDWFGSGSWRVAYSPDYEACNRDDNPACLIGGHAYDFVLDMTGLLQAGENRIEIAQTERSITNALVLKDLAIVDAPPKVASLEPVEDPGAPLKLIAPTDRSKVDIRVKVLPHGGLLVSSGKRSFTISSSFSYPNAGWNTLSSERQSGEEEAWRPMWPAKSAGNRLQIEACGKSYRLRRSITRAADHLAITDTLTNLAPADLHISLKHMISTADLDKLEVFVHGQRSRIGQGYDTGGDNPTIFVRSGDDGVGLVAEDDVFRAQSAQQATMKPAEAGLLDHYFMLEPGASYDVRWSIYPTPNGGYFDFVNAVRRNWGTNFTIPGPFAFAPHPTREQAETPDLKAWLSNGGMKIVSLQIPMPEPAVLSHGLAFLKETAEQQRLKEQAERLRAAAPGLKVLQYLHVYITRLDEAVKQYEDARHIGADGKQLQYPAGSWKPTFWLFLPTTTNAYGRDMNQTFDLVLDKLGFDGVYWDELAYSAKEIAYGISDGHTALPNMQSLTVQEKVAFTPLYCQAYQVQQAKRVLNAGKLLIGNGQPVTETMTKLHFPRFVEAWNASRLCNAHLYTPLGLGSPDKLRSEEYIVPGIRSHLMNGGLWYYYCGWNQVKLTHPCAAGRLFPFTPIELHEGYLIGQERILTAKSGLFGWGDRSKVKVYAYTPDGLEVKGFRAPIREVKGQLYTEIRVPQGGIAIIERVR